MVFYYHHIFWDKFSAVCAIPCLLFVLYRFIYRVDYQSVSIREKYRSYWQGLNLLNWDYKTSVSKVKEEDGPSEKHQELKGDAFDTAFKYYLAVGGFHYTLDCFVKMHTYGFDILNEGCKLWYFIHHLLTLINFKSLWMLDTYPWFMAFPACYHCVMVACPKFFLNNYIYGASIAFYVILQLYYKPFRNNKVHKMLLVKCGFILIPILHMATMSC